MNGGHAPVDLLATLWAKSMAPQATIRTTPIRVVRYR